MPMLLPFGARTRQILSLTTFLLLGVATRDWTLQVSKVGIILLTCLAVQMSLSLFVSWRADLEQSSSELSQPLNRLAFDNMLHSLPSALITGLGLSLLLRADHIATLVLASTAAISSKFLLRLNGKHIFNPANFGIVVALVATQDAWVSPGQWGEEGWYALLFLGAGGLVLKLVGRWDTSIAFLMTYGGLEAIRNVWLGWTWDVWVHRLMSGSLLLFALFMITDPRTIPNARSGRLIWAAAIGLLSFLLRNLWFMPTAVFWALFCLAPLSILIDRILPASAFRWNTSCKSEQKPDGPLQDLSLHHT